MSELEDLEIVAMTSSSTRKTMPATTSPILDLGRLARAGKMGWWGMVSDEKDPGLWQSRPAGKCGYR